MAAKRVAVLISGTLRTFWFTYRSVMENLIEPNDADVFVYTGWDRLGNREHRSCSSIASRGGKPLDFDERDFFGKALGEHLKAFVFIEDEFESYVNEFRAIYPRCPYCLRTPTTPCPGCALPSPTEKREWYHIDAYLRLRRCNELRRQYEAKHGVRYDALVRLRGDTMLSFPIPLADYPLEPNDLHIEHTHPPHQREAFFFGGRDIMDTICTRFPDEYGREAGSDLVQFGSFIRRHGARVRCLNSEEQHFRADPDYPRRRCSRTGRSCICCLDGAPYGAEVPVDYDNEIARRFGIQRLKVLVI